MLRAVAYIVRDEDWGTYVPILANLETRQDAETFRVSYDARCVAVVNISPRPQIVCLAWSRLSSNCLDAANWTAASKCDAPVASNLTGPLTLAPFAIAGIDEIR